METVDLLVHEVADGDVLQLCLVLVHERLGPGLHQAPVHPPLNRVGARARWGPGRNPGDTTDNMHIQDNTIQYYTITKYNTQFNDSNVRQEDAHMRAILINGVNYSCLLKGLAKLQMSLKILARSSKGAL